MSEIIIIGSGPAGISASLYCVRANLATTIVTTGKSAVASSEKIENYYGFPDGISGGELYSNGIKQAENLGVKFIEDEVFAINYDGRFSVVGKNGEYPADGVIIATGSKRTTPKIKGIKEFEGKGVSYCAVCDAFFFRGKNVAVLGNSDYALHEVKDLLPVAASVSVLTDGAEATVGFPENVKVIKEKLSELKGEARLSSLVFENGDEISCDGVFVALGVAGSTELARKIGAYTENNKIRVDENMKTTVNNLYAAGDCVGGLLQVSTAVAEGAKAATELIKSLRKQ